MSLFIKGADLISLEELQDEEINEILSFAGELKSRSQNGEEFPLLQGVQLFLFDPDRVMPAWDPFRVAIGQLGGQAHDINPEKINLAWSETFLDLFAQLDRTGHGLAMASIRPGEGHGFIQDTASLMRRPVLNMISDRQAPCQTLATLMAVEERLHGDMPADVAVCWAPPGISQKPASLPFSLTSALLQRGVNLRLASPPEFHPEAEYLERMDSLAPGALQVLTDPDDAIAAADLVFSLNWAPAGSAEGLATMEHGTEQHSAWRLTKERFALANGKALLGGGLPQSRGVEIDEELLESTRAIHLDEAANLLHVSKALLALILDLYQEHMTPHESIQ